jgi:hypothetical protein
VGGLLDGVGVGVKGHILEGSAKNPIFGRGCVQGQEKGEGEE